MLGRIPEESPAITPSHSPVLILLGLVYGTVSAAEPAGQITKALARQDKALIRGKAVIDWLATEQSCCDSKLESFRPQV